MDAERVEVLHVADRDAVVVCVTDYLVFDLLPPLEAFLDEDLGREGEGFLSETDKLVFVVAESRSQASEGESGAQDHRVSQFFSRRFCSFDALASFALDGLYADLVESFYEEFTVFRIDDGLHGGSQHADPVFLQNPTLEEFNTAVECSLAAKGEQDAVRTFLFYDLPDE